MLPSGLNNINKGSESNHNHKISLLYVDDEEDLLEIGKIFLERSGKFKVDTISSAQEALDSVSIESYDAIISDYQMQGMDGIAFLKEVRKSFPEIPFILFTGRGREEVVIEAINNGADFYVQKGGDARSQFAELSNHILQAVRRRQAELEHRIQFNELIKTKEALEISEERFRGMTERSPDLVLILDKDMRPTYVSPSSLSIIGYQPEELIGISPEYTSATIFSACVPPIEDIMNIVRRGEAIENLDIQIHKKDGTPVSANMYSIPVIYDGVFTGVQVAIRDITQSKKTEQALRDSEEKFRVLAETAPFAIIVYQDSKHVFVNDYAIKKTGYTKEEFNSLNFWDLLHPDYREIAKERGFSRLKGENTSSRYEVRYITKSGEVFWADLTAGIIQYGGKPAVIVLMVGITERKKAEEELQGAYEQLAASDEELRVQFDALKESLERIHQSEENYRSIIEHLPGAFYRVDIEGKLLILSPSFAEQFGYASTEDLIGKNVNDFLYANTSERDEFLKKLKKQRKLKAERLRIKNPDGTYGVASVSCHILHDETGKPVGVEGIIQDITHTVRMEEALIECERMHHLLENNIHDVIWTADLDMNLIYISPSVMNQRGFTQEEAIAISLKNSLTPESYEVIMKNRQEAMEAINSGKTVPNRQKMELTFLHKDGHQVLTEVIITPAFDRNGIPIGVFGVARDISE